ncbi:MAG TPA: glycosyltransferase [Bryobacteraceae bacterium]|nr:glycosyltransferase [Bryobacteraceae bacterium]
MKGAPAVELVYVDSGGGHRAAAQALEAVVRQRRMSWEVRLQGMQELLNSIDFIRMCTGIEYQEIYNIMLRRGWTRGTRQLIPVMHLLIRLSHPAQVRVLERHWRECPVDMVVSLIPHYTRAMRQAFARACPGRPFVTIMTDIADYPPHFWIENLDQYLICGSEKARQQARAIGLPADRILPMRGMILHPRFHEPPAIADRSSARIQLGLRPDLPTGLVLFGGIGSKDTLRVARALNRPGAGVQLIVLCGRDEESQRELRAMDPHIPMRIEGFTREVPRFMALADFFIGKPGPGSISEALAMGLPVIVEWNSRTMVHERYNVRWIREQEVGVVVANFERVGQAVRELLQPDRYRRLKANAAALKNHAVYDAVAWLERILEGRGVLHDGGQPAEAFPQANLNSRLTLA